MVGARLYAIRDRIITAIETEISILINKGVRGILNMVAEITGPVPNIRILN